MLLLLSQWTPSNFLTDFNGFHVKRDATKGFEAKIELHFHASPQPAAGSPASSTPAPLDPSRRLRAGKLQPIANSHSATLPEILAKLWEYINAQRLRESQSKVIKCDAMLREIFGVDELRIHELRENVTALLTDANKDAEPAVVTIPYRVCLRSNEAEEFAYDIEVPIADRVSSKAVARLQAAAASGGADASKVAALDAQLEAVRQSLADAKRIRDLACRVMMDPVHMMADQIASSQIRDQQVLTAMTDASTDSGSVLSTTGEFLTPSAAGKRLCESFDAASAKRVKYWTGDWVDEGAAAMTG